MRNSKLPYRYSNLWPLLLLLCAEAAAPVAFARLPRQDILAISTPFSALVAGLILLSGLLPALLRPGQETLLAGCLATVLASILVTPFSVTNLPINFFNKPVIQAGTAFLLLRLINGISIGPLAFHLAARFPLRSNLSSRWLAFSYLVSYAILLVFLLAAQKTIRITAGLALLTWTLVLIVGAIYLLLKASRAVNPDNPRPAQQARLLFLSIALGGLVSFLRPLGIIFRNELISYNLMLAALVVIPLGIAYAVLRHDLFGIDRALRRGLAYASLSVLLLIIYFALTIGFTALLANIWSGWRGLAALISLFVAALAFEPSRKKLQYWIDRFLYPDRLNFQQAVSEASAALTRVVNKEEILQLLSHDLPPRLGAEWASLSLAPHPDVPGQASSQPAWNAQLIVGGQVLGRYWLGPRRAGPSYDADEQAQLHALAGQAAQALAYADTIEALSQLNRELETRVTQRTVQVLDQQRALAAYDERQRLARDLHDSITQSLFSINLSARALRGMVRRDPTATVSGLSELEQAAQQALAEMRALLAHLREPSPEMNSSRVQAAASNESEMLDFVLLLKEHCARLESGRNPNGNTPILQVNLEAPSSLLLPVVLAHELIQVIREALHNIVKHSRAHQADCRLAHINGWLRFTIQDNGAGFDLQALPSNSFGLLGMHERLAALDGALEIHTAPGQGTTLEMAIPFQEANQ